MLKNQRLFRIKQYLRNHQKIFYLSILCADITIFLIFANFSIFWRMFNCYFWNANLGYLEAFLGFVYESKVVQNQKIQEKPSKKVLIWVKIHIFLIFANLSIFWRMFNCNFWNANLGYLEDFFAGMLKSKFALNILKRKVTIIFGWKEP